MPDGEIDTHEVARSALKEHFDAGRITAEEYDARLEEIKHGLTESVFDDLPEPHASYDPQILSKRAERWETIGTSSMFFGFPILGIVSFILNSWIPVTIAAVVFIVGWGVAGQLNRAAARTFTRPVDASNRSKIDRIRLSDADRRAAVEMVQHHRDLGRLNLVDYEGRMARAATLVDRADLHDLFKDLPEPWPDMTKLVPPAVARHKRAQEVRKWDTTYINGICGSLILVGLPMSITYTAEGGPWWTIALDIVAIIVAFGISAKIDPA